MYYLTETTDRATLEKIMDDVPGVFDAVLDHMLENDIATEKDMSDNDLRDVMRAWVEAGDETYKH